MLGAYDVRERGRARQKTGGEGNARIKKGKERDEKKQVKDAFSYMVLVGE